MDNFTPLLLYHDLTQSIVAALEAKDAYTANHSLRVSELVVKVCRLLKLPEQEITKIHMASHVHDIGKIGVPDYILFKPDSLNEDEWEIMMKHPVTGARILNKCGGLSEIADIVLHHHERWNGRGYPGRIAGEEIPLGARIIAVCDSIDAMMSKRAYRTPLERSECRFEIVRNRGAMYQPEIADLVLENWESVVDPVEIYAKGSGARPAEAISPAGPVGSVQSLDKALPA